MSNGVTMLDQLFTNWSSLVLIILGVGYLVTAAILLSSAVGGCDGFAGRGGAGLVPPPPRRRPGPAPVVAQVVEDP